MRTLRWIIFLAITLVAIPAAADDGAPLPADEPTAADVVGAPLPADEPTAVDVAGAPLPADESGRIDLVDERESAGRLIARGALLVPRAVVKVVFLPVEGVAWTMERYQLVERARRFFFNDAGTFGIVPTVALRAGFGADVGARLVHYNLFGERERVDVRAAAGGRYRHRASARFASGERLGPVQMVVAGEYEQRPNDALYGIGNGPAMESRFEHQLLRGTAKLKYQLVDAVYIRASGAVADHEVATLEDVRNLYAELEAGYDSRRAAVVYEPRAVVSTGFLLAAFGGRATALDDSGDFYRYGFDAQQFFRIGAGPRVLSFRTHGEAVSGDAPVIELPALGGDGLLRGYATDRFRDRVALVGTVEYSWDLTTNFGASLFVDCGRVHESIDRMSTDDMRVGYGIELDLRTQQSFLARASLASSIDGGVFFNLGFEPAFALDERIE